MKVAWHIVRKDLLRLKWILVLWIVVLIGGLMLATIQARLDVETYYPFYIAADVIMRGIVPLIAFGLVMGLVHDDPVAAVDAFWITRPISGGELLAGKAIAWLIIGLLPAAVMLPFWLSHDFGWRQIASAASGTLAVYGLIAVVALPFAVLSANGSKFVMNVILGTGGILLLTLLIRLGYAPDGRTTAPELLQSRVWIIASLWLLGTTILTLNQFLRRRTRQSLIIVAVVVLIGSCVAKWWPWKLESAVSVPAPVATAARHSLRSVIFPLEINGEMKPVTVLAEVPLQAGKQRSHAGITLYVQSELVDFTQQLQVSFSEAAPDIFGRLRDLLPGGDSPPRAPEYYFIYRHHDKRAFVIKPNWQPNELDAAGLRFSHATVAIRPASRWQGGTPANLAEWLKGAVLAKAVAANWETARTITRARSVNP